MSEVLLVSLALAVVVAAVYLWRRWSRSPGQDDSLQEESARKVLDWARRRFFETREGFSAALCARETGVSIGVLERRFGTSEDILIEALAPGGTEPETEGGPSEDELPTKAPVADERRRLLIEESFSNVLRPFYEDAVFEPGPDGSFEPEPIEG